LSLKDQILSAEDRPSEEVPVKEWGCSVWVTTLAGTDRDDWERWITDAEGKVTTANIRARLLVRCLADEPGNRLFTDEEAVALGRKSAAVLDRLFTIAQRLNGLSRKDVAELKKG
jgi:hypothetical protein